MRKTLKKVSLNLYRHTGNKAYWGSKKIAGKAQWHPLGTTDRILAKNLLADWLRDIGELDPQAASDTTLGMMLDRFLATRAGQKPTTVRNEVSIANLIRRGFKPGTGILLVRVKTSDLHTYLVEQATKNEWNGRTFNRHRLFLDQMFRMAVADRLFNEISNPFKPRIFKRRKNDKVTLPLVWRPSLRRPLEVRRVPSSFDRLHPDGVSRIRPRKADYGPTPIR